MFPEIFPKPVGTEFYNIAPIAAIFFVAFLPAILRWRRWGKAFIATLHRMRMGFQSSQEDVNLASLQDQRDELLSVLHDSATTPEGSLDIENVLDRILTHLEQIVPHDVANIMLIESGVTRIIRSNEFGERKAEDSQSVLGLAVDRVPHLRQVMATGQAVVVTDVTANSDRVRFSGPDWVRSHITAPIRIGGQVVGFINMDSASPGFFNATHARQLQTFADNAAVIIENVRLLAESQRHIRELSAINRIQSRINSTLELEWVLRLTMQEVQSLFGVEKCSLMMLDEQTNELSFQVMLGGVLPKHIRININQGIAGWVARTGQPALVNDVRADSRWDPEPDSLTGFTTRSILGVPIRSREKVIGVIELINKMQGIFTDSDLSLLDSITSSVAGAIENARLFGELDKAYKEMAQTQALVIESRNTLRTLVDGIDDSLCIVDKDLRVVALNRASAAEIGVEPRLGVGRFCYEILEQSNERCGECLVMETFRTGKSNLITRSRIEKSGKRRELEIRAFPLENSDGVIDRVIEIVRDVTDKRKMEATLVQSAKLYAVGELAAGIAHEINNPLTAVYGNAQMLLRALEPGDPRHQMAQLIERAGLRASKVVHNLLDFSRQEDYQFAPTDLNATIEDALTLMLHHLQRGMVTVTKDLQTDLPPVNASASHLQTVWTNLLLNARDAIDEQAQGQILISTKLSRDSQSVEVLFQDNGPGIAEKDMARIFDPFFTTKPRGRGSGLGLYVSNIIVANHQGTMQVQSKIGEGAAFIVSLPVETTEK